MPKQKMIFPFAKCKNRAAVRALFKKPRPYSNFVWLTSFLD